MKKPSESHDAASSSQQLRKKHSLDTGIYTAVLLAVLQSGSTSAEETLIMPNKDLGSLFIRYLESGDSKTIEIAASDDPIDTGRGEALFLNNEGIVNVSNATESSADAEIAFPLPYSGSLALDLQARTFTTSEATKGELYLVKTDFSDYQVYKPFTSQQGIPPLTWTFVADQLDETPWAAAKNSSTNSSLGGLFFFTMGADGNGDELPDSITQKYKMENSVVGSTADWNVDHRSNAIYLINMDTRSLRKIAVDPNNFSKTKIYDVSSEEEENERFVASDVELTDDYVLVGGAYIYYIDEDENKYYCCGLFRYDKDLNYIDQLLTLDNTCTYVPYSLAVETDGSNAWLLTDSDSFQVDLEDGNFKFTEKTYENPNYYNNIENGMILHVTSPGTLNFDGDGYSYYTSTGESDCDDWDASIFPGAQETCNDQDNDCDGEIDEGACAPGETPTTQPENTPTQGPPDPTDPPDETHGGTPSIDETDSDDETPDPGTGGEGTDSDEGTPTPGAELTLPPWSTPTPAPASTEEVSAGCGGCDTNPDGTALDATALLFVLGLSLRCRIKEKTEEVTRG